MRRILVDNARRKRSLKRGGNLALAELDESRIAAPCPDDELLAVHEALDRLVAVDPAAAVALPSTSRLRLRPSGCCRWNRASPRPSRCWRHRQTIASRLDPAIFRQAFHSSSSNQVS